MRKIGITADCVCDLPDEYLAFNDIEVIYFTSPQTQAAFVTA